MKDYEPKYFVDFDMHGASARMAVSYDQNRSLTHLKLKNDYKFKKVDGYLDSHIRCDSRHDAKLVAAAINLYHAWLTGNMKRRKAMTNFTFTTREEYLVYRAEWKTKYMENSKIIRDLKKEIKNYQSAGKYAGDMQCEREILRDAQRTALKELALAKVEAAEQYKSRIERERKAA